MTNGDDLPGSSAAQRAARVLPAARILDGNRALASAPPDVSRELWITAQAEADARQQSADAQTDHDPARSAGATALGRRLAARSEQLEAANARYEKWAVGTSSRREAAGKARAELERCELAQHTAGQRHAGLQDEPLTLMEWWRQFEAGLAAVDRAIEREQQAAIAAGQPWPPQRTAQAQTTHAEAAAVIARPQRDGYRPEPDLYPDALTCEPAAANTDALTPRREPGGRPARLDALQARADQAAHRITAGNAAQEARAQYTARLDREAHTQADPAAGRQAEPSDGIEIEQEVKPAPRRSPILGQGIDRAPRSLSRGDGAPMAGCGPSPMSTSVPLPRANSATRKLAAD